MTPTIKADGTVVWNPAGSDDENLPVVFAVVLDSQGHFTDASAIAEDGVVVGHVRVQQERLAEAMGLSDTSADIHAKCAAHYPDGYVLQAVSHIQVVEAMEPDAPPSKLRRALELNAR